MAQAAQDTNQTIEGLNQQAAALWQQGKKKDAAALFEQALHMDPFNPMSLNAMGVVMNDLKKYEKAEQYFLKALTFASEEASIYDNLGRALYFLKRFDEAAARFNTAIEIDPDQPEYYFNLGTVLYDLRLFEEAAKNHGFCIERAPDHIGSLIGKGQSLANLGHFPAAGDCYKKALEVDPENEIAYHNLYIYYDMTHEPEKLEKIITSAREHIKGTARLAYMEAHQAYKEKRYEDGIKALADVEIESDPLSVDILFEAGWLYDKAGEPEMAFNCLTQANLLQSQGNNAITINIDAFPDLLASEKNVFKKSALKNWAPTPPNTRYPNPIFLTGFPRSGTTLAGQILHSHPDIYVGEENGAIEEVRTFIAKKTAGYPASLALLDAAIIEEARDVYFAVHKRQEDWEDKKFIIDKSPMSSAQVGLIHRIFPEARFIFVRRHPCDCVLSCFMQKFRPSLSLVQFMDIERAARFYIQTMDSWNHYDKLLSLDYHTLRYETLTANFETEIRALLDYIGADWNEDVLEYNAQAKANPRTITPSYSQITKKIYTSARGRWESYLTQMEPVLDLLAPYVEEAGYPPIETITRQSNL